MKLNIYAVEYSETCVCVSKLKLCLILGFPKVPKRSLQKQEEVF